MANSNPPIRIKVDGYEFEFTREEIQAADFIKTSPTEATLIHQYQSAAVRLLETDIQGKNSRIEMDGQEFQIQIKDELDQRLDQMGFNSSSTKHVKEVKAPMPGMVLEISVSEGQEVKEGERLLILSAMKMENSIQIHADAIIKQVLVKAGQAVDKGQVLVTLV